MPLYTSNKQHAMSGINIPGYFTRLIAKTHILFLLMTVAIWLVCAGASYGDIIINAPMTDTNSTGWVLGGNPASSLLTGNGTIDPVGSGWLRLTSNSGDQTGYAYNTTTFDLSQGLLIQFDYSTWGGTGADGYSVYLFDAGVGTFNIGAFGGSLGYAQKLPPAVPTAVPGISGGYVGIGVDEYGNFSNPTEGRYLGPGARPNTVTVRGPVVGFGGGAVGLTANAASYPWIATSANSGSLWYNGTPRPSQTGTDYRRVTILISPAPNPVANVWVQFGYNSSPTQMITNATLPAISTSQQLQMGYAASTGGSTNYHEIRSLLVTNANTSTAIDVGITKSVLDTTTSSTTTTAVGHGIRYTIVARNYGPNNITATGVGIVDNIPASITGVTWTCAASGGATCGAASGSGNTLNTTANLPRYGAVTYTINGTVGTSSPSTLTNTASLVIPGSVTDYNSSDDSATASIAVTSNLSASTKTWLDVNGGDQNPGDVIRYTITLNESTGAAASGVTVTDSMPANVGSFTVVSVPAGATNSSTSSGGTNGTGYLNVTGISVPAGGSATIVFDVTINSGVTAGTVIDNTAMVANPNGTGATPAAPSITVSSASIPGSGTKPLYLYDSTSSPAWKLSRTNNTSTTGYATINTATSRTWAMNPAAAAGITISSAVSTTVPVTIYMRRNTTTQTKNIRVDLQCSSGGTALTLTRSCNITGTITAYTFNLPLAGTLTCGAGNYWNLTVSQTSGTDSTRVYPRSVSSSHVDLPATTVINVDSIGFYDAAYPGGGALTSIRPGDTVRVRATVSDPFGSYDITGATLTLTNPSGAVQFTGSMGTPVYDSGAATKIYEYSYTVPSGAATGNWTAMVLATEGTEGTITDTGVTTIVVALPSVSLVKLADKATITPGGIITYTLVASNSGTGVASSITVDDTLSTYIQFGIDSYGSGVPFQFTDSTPSSGLALGTPVYSNNNGSTWTYTPVSGGGGAPAGYDGNITNWKIPLTGTMNGNGANFTINYKVRVK